MTIAEIMQDLQAIRHQNDDEQTERIKKHLLRLENTVRFEVLGLPEKNSLSEDEILKVGVPYDTMYLQYAKSMQDLENMEYQSYNNNYSIFVSIYEEYQRQHRAKVTPRNKTKVKNYG